ncbi:MAG: phytanoyl-CoA dioxygenase family protein [Myxococcota bacterium]
MKSNPHLSAGNAERAGIDHAWDQDNQAWWDWYVSLAAGERPQIDVQLAPPPRAEPPSPAELLRELGEPYPLTLEHQHFFRTNGFIKLPGVLSPGAVTALREQLVAELIAEFGGSLDGGVTDRFLSLEMVWLRNEVLGRFVLSPRIAGICAGLLGVERVRLYHDNVLSKEPGCRRTPWHYDDTHFPLDTHDVVTAWIPAQPIPIEMGPLAFAKGIELYREVEKIEFNKHDTSYDEAIGALLQRLGAGVDESAFSLGEVSFHHNLSLHTAESNRTTVSRIVLANTFFVDGARVVDSPTMVSGDWQKFMPGVGPGEPAASELNPVCWPPESS